MSTQIMKYDAARNALAEANSIDDIKVIADKTEALQHYAKQIHDTDMEIWLAEIKIRAKCKLGELTKDIPKSTPEILNPDAGIKKKDVLKQAGISTQEASRCEKLADTEEEYFDEAFAEAKKSKKPVTYASIEKKIKDKQKNTTVEDKKDIYTQATNASVELNRPKIHHGDCLDYMADMDDRSVDLLITDPPYSTDVDDIDLFASSWVLTAINKVKLTGRAYICIGAYPKELQAYLNILLNEQDDFIVDNPLIWSYKNTLGNTPKMKYNLNYQVILHLYTKDSPELDTSITNEMFSVQEINAPDGRLGDRYHTWQKPDKLAMQLITHSTQEGDVIFDPFACTGTFLIAASKLKRVGVGCEIDSENLNIAIERGCINE